MKYRELLTMIEEDGWRNVRTTGSHLHFRHTTKPGTLTIPGDGKLGREVPPGTLRSILRQAGLSDVR